MVAIEADPQGEATTERRATVIAGLGNVLDWYDFTRPAMAAALSSMRASLAESVNLKRDLLDTK